MTVSTAQVLPGGFELPLEPRLPRIGAVDQVALEERAASLAKRSIKKESKLQALDLAIAIAQLRGLNFIQSDRPKEYLIAGELACAVELGHITSSRPVTNRIGVEDRRERR